MALSFTMFSALFSALFSARPAAAHSSAQSTEPVSGSTVPTAPLRVLVRFNGPVQFGFGALRVIDANGDAISGVGDTFRPDGQADAIAAKLPPTLANGAYIVAFQVLSADGHKVSGAFSFSVGVGSAAPSSELLDKLASGAGSANSSVTTTATFGRFVVFAGAIVAIGTLAFLMFLWSAGAARRGLGRLMVGAAAFGALASLAQIGLVGALALGRGFGAVFDSNGWSIVMRGAVGRWWLLRTLGLAVIAGLAATRRRLAVTWWRVAFLSAALLTFVAMANGGHGTTDRWPIVGVVSTVIHLGAVTFWIGGLVGLLVAYGTGSGSALAKRFSNPALIAVGVVVATGLVQTKRQILAFADFRDTDYGRSLTSKLIVFAVLLAIALLSRILTKRADNDLETALKPRDAIGMEVLFAVGIVALTATLVNQPPPQAQAAKPFSESVFTGRREAQIIIEPATAGANSVHLTILDGNALAAGPGAKNPTTLLLRFSLDSKNIPPIKAEPTQFLANHATFDNVVLPVKGTWKLDVIATYGAEQVLFSLPVKIS
jgi:copper transport protein